MPSLLRRAYYMPANTVDTGVIINGETARFSEMSWEGGFQLRCLFSALHPAARAFCSRSEYDPPTLSVLPILLGLSVVRRSRCAPGWRRCMPGRSAVFKRHTICCMRGRCYVVLTCRCPMGNCGCPSARLVVDCSVRLRDRCSFCAIDVNCACLPYGPRSSTAGG